MPYAIDIMQRTLLAPVISAPRNQARRRLLLSAGCAALGLGAPPLRAQGAAAPPYPQRPEVREFIDELVHRHHLDREFVERAFAQARYSPQAERLTTPSTQPAAARNWLDYRTRNVDELRVRDGAQFMRDSHAKVFEIAETAMKLSMRGSPDHSVRLLIQEGRTALNHVN